VVVSRDAERPADLDCGTCRHGEAGKQGQDAS
jgi:hypothetical protein